MGGTVSFDNFPIQVNTAIFGEAGDTFVDKITSRGLSKDSYLRRHVLVSGFFKIETMVDDEVVGEYWTESENIMRLRHGVVVFPTHDEDITGWKLTALADNSSYHCILPLRRKIHMVKDTITRIPAGGGFGMKTGRLYIANVPITVNGILKNPFEPVACIYNEMDVFPQQDCAMAEFYIEPYVKLDL
jgi:hypothetical protein